MVKEKRSYGNLGTVLYRMQQKGHLDGSPFTGTILGIGYICQTTNHMKKLLKELREQIKKDYDSKCRKFEPFCMTCMAYMALEILESLYET